MSAQSPSRMRSQLDYMIGAMQCFAPNPCGDGHLCIHHQIAQYAARSETQPSNPTEYRYAASQVPEAARPGERPDTTTTCDAAPAFDKRDSLWDDLHKQLTEVRATVDALETQYAAPSAIAPNFTPPGVLPRYAAPFKLMGRKEEWVQVRFVSHQHIKDKPTEANPTPVRVIVVADLERVQPHALANGPIGSDSEGGAAK